MTVIVPVLSAAGCGGGSLWEDHELGTWGPDVVVDDTLHDFDVQAPDSGDKLILPDGFTGFGDARAREIDQEDVFQSDAESDSEFLPDYGYDYGYDNYSWDQGNNNDVGWDEGQSRDEGGVFDTSQQDSVMPDIGVDYGQYDVVPDSSNPCEVDLFEYDGNLDNAREVQAGEPGSGSICPSGDKDVFWFYIGSTSNVVIETSGSGGDSTLTLVSGDGDQIAFDDDGGPGAYSRIVIDGLTAGDYFVFVAGYEDHVLSYSLSLVIDDNVVEPTPDVIMDY